MVLASRVIRSWALHLHPSSVSQRIWVKLRIKDDAPILDEGDEFDPGVEYRAWRDHQNFWMNHNRPVLVFASEVDVLDE